MPHYDTHWISDPSPNSAVRIFPHWFEGFKHHKDCRLIISGTQIVVGPMGYFENWISLLKEAPQELVDLAQLVRRDRENGPWRQLIDWLAQNLELFSEKFATGFKEFLAAAEET